MERYRLAGINCKGCGSALYVDEYEKITICPYCKRQIVPESMKKWIETGSNCF